MLIPIQFFFVHLQEILTFLPETRGGGVKSHSENLLKFIHFGGKWLPIANNESKNFHTEVEGVGQNITKTSWGRGNAPPMIIFAWHTLAM